MKESHEMNVMHTMNDSHEMNEILNRDVYDYLTDFEVYEELTNLQKEAILSREIIGDGFGVLYVDRKKVAALEEDFYDYQSIPKLFTLTDIEDTDTVDTDTEDINDGLTLDKTIDDKAPKENHIREYELRTTQGVDFLNSGILQMQRSPLNLVGRGTVICIIDTGIDYTNPAFIDRDGRTRILAIWDQTIQTGQPPEGFLYGTEYTEEMINRALESENPYDIVPSRDDNGHGTAMAMVAAGRIVTMDAYIGAAPEAKLVIVKLKECKQYLREYYLIPQSADAFQENDIMQGAKYGEGFIDLFKRPVVICIGLGTNMGDHNGNGILARYLNSLASKRNMAVVVGGGNEGNSAHHFQGDLMGITGDYTAKSGADYGTGNLYQDVEIRVSDGCRGFFMELWGNAQDAMNVYVISPGGEVIPPIRLGVEKSMTYGFTYEPSILTIDSILVEQSSGDELILFRLQNPTPGIWTIRVVPVGNLSNGVYHLWLPVDAFLEVPVYFIMPSPYVTLTEPSMAANVICVSAYRGENGSFYINSGRGYTRTGSVKPDLAAQGVNIPVGNGRRTGSSIAASITAGAVAQFLQWAVVEDHDRYADSIEVKSYLIRGARKEAGIQYPNREWGYGKLNVEGTFNILTRV